MGDLCLSAGCDAITLCSKVVPIEDSYDKNEEYKSVVERYFTVRYILNIGMELSNYAVMLHSNRICVITLAPSHFLVSTKQTIINVEYGGSALVNPLHNVVSGKWKRGAQFVDKLDTILFYVNCADGRKIAIYGGIRGKLVEINPLIADDPNIMIRDPWGKGYIGVILPTSNDYEYHKKKMLTADEPVEGVNHTNTCDD